MEAENDPATNIILNMKGISNTQLKTKSKDFLVSIINKLMEAVDIDMKVLLITMNDNVSNHIAQLRNELKLTADDLANFKSDINDKIHTLSAKINSIVDAQTLPTTNNIINTGNSQPNIKSIHDETLHTDNYKYQFKLHGVAEPKDNNNHNRLNADLTVVKSVLDHLKLPNATICNIHRLGHYASEKSRPIVVKLNTIWDVRTVFNNVSTLKSYTIPKLYISKDLSFTERLLEKQLLRLRYELISKGVDKSNIKIRNLKLYVNNKLYDSPLQKQ